MIARRPSVLRSGWLAAALAIGACGPEPVSFTYEAPVGRRFVLDEQMTQTTDVAPGGRFEVDVRGRSRIRVERESAWRVHWIETIESGSIRISKPMRNFDLGDIVGGYEVRTDFSDSGEAVGVEGLGAVSSALLRHFLESGLLADPAAFAPGSSGDEHLAVWNERVYALAGLRLSPGETAEAAGRQDLGAGIGLDYLVTLTLGDELPCPGDAERRCVKLALEYTTSDEAAAAVRGRRFDDLGYDLSTVIDQAELTGTGERVLDPATLLVYDEKRDPVLHLTGSAQGDRFDLTLRQHHTWKLRPAS